MEVSPQLEQHRDMFMWIQCFNNAECVLSGAYVIGDGRQDDCGFAAKTLLQHTSATHVLCPQYRLASNPGGRFPSQLQNAITSLLYLIDEIKVPNSQITISGDSAGGNLCLALLRYIADNPKAEVPSPGCAFLWSPWVDLVFPPPCHLNIMDSANKSC
jgi:acetyl esterase/lipase